MSTVVESIVTGQAEIARRPLAAERCALVVIDIQQKLLPPIFQKEQLVRNAQLLIRAAEILKIPALISTQYAKGLGGTVPEIASLLGIPLGTAASRLRRSREQFHAIAKRVRARAFGGGGAR